MTSPTQVALRELMILTKCYCDGEHPRLGHNCSFRPDVETLVDAIAAVLTLCEESEQVQYDYVAAVDVRNTLLGLDGATEDTPLTSLAREELAPFSAQLAARLQAAQATPTEDDARRPPTG